MISLSKKSEGTNYIETSVKIIFHPPIHLLSSIVFAAYLRLGHEGSSKILLGEMLCAIDHSSKVLCYNHYFPNCALGQMKTKSVLTLCWFALNHYLLWIFFFLEDLPADMIVGIWHFFQLLSLVTGCKRITCYTGSKALLILFSKCIL